MKLGVCEKKLGYILTDFANLLGPRLLIERNFVVRQVEELIMHQAAIIELIKPSLFL